MKNIRVYNLYGNRAAFAVEISCNGTPYCVKKEGSTDNYWFDLQTLQICWPAGYKSHPIGPKGKEFELSDGELQIEKSLADYYLNAPQGPWDRCARLLEKGFRGDDLP